MSGWPVVELGDLAEFINGGAWNQSAYSESGVPVVRVTNIRGDHIDLSDCKYLPFNLLQTYRKHILHAGDLIIATVGSHPTQPNSVVGRPAVVSEAVNGCLLNQNAVLLRANSSQVDQRWLGYLGKSSTFRDYIIECARGSANQVRMSIALLKKMPVPLPPLDTQRRIASILGAYDDLIEVNRRRVAVLEEMARGLFEEWFVRFRFPGHESVPLVDTPDGPLPQGWVWGTLGDIGASTGKSITPSAHTETTFAHYSLPAFDTGRAPAMDRGETIKSNKIHVQGPVVLVSKLNPRIPRVWLVPEHNECTQVASTEFVPIQSKGGMPLSYIFSIVNSESFRDRLVGMAGGTSTSHQRVKPKDVFATPIACAPADLVSRAGETLSSLYDLVSQLERANRALAASRDLLLPRLISGQLSVEAAEKELELAA